MGPISESIDSASIGEFKPFLLLVEDSKFEIWCFSEP